VKLTRPFCGTFRILTALHLAGGVLVVSTVLTCSSPARGHGGDDGGQMHRGSSHWHDYNHRNYYPDPFWRSWYPGYQGIYDSSYWYTPTPEQQAAAQKEARAYLDAIRKGKKRASTHRYIAVRTLRPTKKQLQDYLNKRAAAKSAAANSNTQLSNRWVDPSQLRCVMVFDTQSKQFVGSGCYVIASSPPMGTTAKFDTITAEFVGSSEL
jgi:hypothetical protein